MNRLSISEFTDFADAFVHANTPISLLNGLVGSSGMRKLRERDINDLLQRYDEVTARPKRNAYIMGLAYAILCAILLHARESSDKINFDETRLDWGQAIRAYMERATITTATFKAQMTARSPIITVVDSPSSNNVGILYGPHGHQLP